MKSWETAWVDEPELFPWVADLMHLQVRFRDSSLSIKNVRRAYDGRRIKIFELRKKKKKTQTHTLAPISKRQGSITNLGIYLPNRGGFSLTCDEMLANDFVQNEQRKKEKWNINKTTEFSIKTDHCRERNMIFYSHIRRQFVIWHGQLSSYFEYSVIQSAFFFYILFILKLARLKNNEMKFCEIYTSTRKALQLFQKLWRLSISILKTFVVGFWRNHAMFLE